MTSDLPQVYYGARKQGQPLLDQTTETYLSPHFTLFPELTSFPLPLHSALYLHLDLDLARHPSTTSARSPIPCDCRFLQPLLVAASA